MNSKNDDFGSIRNNHREIEVTQNASLTTISIALMLTDEAIGHKPLVIQGSPDFHRLVLETALEANLPISFQAADRYEGVSNRRYMEIEFALPNELKTVEQYRQIIDFFIAKHLSNHYYAYAIHNKIGVMSEGQHHPHVHIMFSERFKKFLIG